MILSTTSKSNSSLLLEPISKENPSGESLRYSDLYDQIREARREDDDNLPQGVWKTDIKKADWDQVERLCGNALKTQTKDLQIAVWLTEAYLQLEGTGGLVRGLELILALTRNFWDTIYPQIDVSGLELRLGPYEWLNTRLSEKCQYSLISMPADRAYLPMRLVDFNEAQRLSASSKKTPAQDTHQLSELSQGSFNKISLSIEQTPTAFYEAMNENCILCLQRIADLEKELRRRLDQASPSFYRLKEKIEGLQHFANQILKARATKKEKKKTKILGISFPSSSRHNDTSPIESREQAYRILGEVATYLERTEPHSPTPYLIRRAISWGDMNLPQVFADTLTNGNDLSLLLDVLNVEKKA